MTYLCLWFERLQGSVALATIHESDNDKDRYAEEEASAIFFLIESTVGHFPTQMKNLRARRYFICG